MPILRAFNVADGILAGERLPEEPAPVGGGECLVTA